MASNSTDPFVIDVQALRKRAREHMTEGAVTQNYGGNVEQAVKVLNDALATEIVCWLRYTFHAITAQGLASESVKAEFSEHAAEELGHAQQLAERINQLNGKPNMNPDGLATRAHSQYAEGTSLVDMIRENLIAERIAVESYREMVRYFADKDPVTRRMLEEILAKEEEHADDMNDLLASHDPEPKKA